MRQIYIVGCLWLGLASMIWSQESDAKEARLKEAQKLVESLKYESGNIPLLNDLATIRLEEGFRYLNPDDAEKVLVKIWGNPESSEKTLGMLVPQDFNPLGAAWAVIISYSDEGYVSDADAHKINYDDLLKQMKESLTEANQQRVTEGYESIELVGWATPPRYDEKEHKLYWAKELKFGDAKESTLNYNIRVLGRKGVLVLNAIAEIHQLKEVEEAGPKILSMVSFNPGNLYADFDSSTDKVATYGIAALVAGGIATKAGLFKGLWLGILAFKKFIIIGLIAAGVWLKNFFQKKSS